VHELEALPCRPQDTPPDQFLHGLGGVHLTEVARAGEEAEITGPTVDRGDGDQTARAFAEEGEPSGDHVTKGWWRRLGRRRRPLG
jgi:hypothetical protein